MLLFRTDKLTFNLLTVKIVSESCVTWANSLKMLVFQGLSVLELFSVHATDRRQRMYAELEGKAQNWTGLGHHPPCTWGVPDTIEMWPLTYVLILLPDQTVREILSKSAWKNVTPRVPPFKVTRGHQNRHESIHHLRLSTNVPYQPWS